MCVICVACQAVTYLHVFRVFLSDSAEAALRDLTLGLMADSGFRTQLLLSLRDPRERAHRTSRGRKVIQLLSSRPGRARACVSCIALIFAAPSFSRSRSEFQVTRGSRERYMNELYWSPRRRSESAGVFIQKLLECLWLITYWFTCHANKIK